MNPSLAIRIAPQEVQVLKLGSNDFKSFPNDAEFEKELKSSLSELGHRNEPIVVLIESSLVLTAEVSKSMVGLQREELAFELESIFPIDVEDMAAIVHGTNKPLAMVVSKPVVNRVLNALTDLKVRIAGVVPESLAIARSAMNLSSKSSGQILLARANSVEHFSFESNELVVWRVFYNASIHEVTAQLEIPDDLVIVGETEIAPDIQNQVENQLGDSVAFLPNTCNELRTQGINLNTKKDAQIDFAQCFTGTSFQSSAQSSLRPLFVCICLLLGSIAAGIFIQGQKLAAATQQNEDEIERLYKKTCPDKGPTQFVERTLKAELTKLEQQIPFANESQNSQRILANLQDLLKAFPSGMIEIHAIAVSPTEVSLKVNAKDPTSFQQFQSKLANVFDDVERSGSAPALQLNLRRATVASGDSP